MSQNFPWIAPTGNLPIRAGNALHVDLNSIQPTQTQDGSPGRPFLTIQQALDEIEARLDASSTNKYAVLISPGQYNEALIGRSPSVKLVCNGAPRSVVISSPIANRAPLIVTDATLASIDAFYAAGGKKRASIVPPVSDQFALLVHDPALVFPNGVTFPRDFEIYGCVLTSAVPLPATDYCLIYVNTQNGTDTSTSMRFTDFCFLQEGMYIRNSYTWNINYCEVTGFLDIRNARTIVLKFCQFSRSAVLEFDALQPVPVGLLLSQIIATETVASLNLLTQGTGPCNCTGFDALFSTVQLKAPGITQLFGCDLTNDLIVEGSAVCTILGGAIGDDVIIQNPVAPVLTINGVHVQDAITLNAGGAKTVTMNGGRYMGILTDPDGVFVRNLGN